MAMLGQTTTRDQIRQQGDKIATMLRSAATKSFEPTLQDTGNALLAAQAVASTVGGKPYEAYQGSLDKTRKTKLEDTERGINSETAIFELQNKLKQSGDADAVAVGEQLAKYPPDRAMEILKAMAEDPEEIGAHNVATKSAIIANRLGVTPLSYDEHKAKVAKLKTDAATPGGATGYLVDQLRAENPNLSYQDALQRVQTGLRQNLIMQDGSVVPVPGAAAGKGMLKQGETRGGEIGKAEGEAEGAIAKKTIQAPQIEELLKQAEVLLPKATSGGLATLGREGAAFFGNATEGSKIDSQLNVISAALTGSVPRFEGPQGVLDVELYKQAAGDLANPRLPRETRLSAIDTMRTLSQRYNAGSESSPMGPIEGMGSAPPKIAIQSEDEYNALPSRAEYIGPDGKLRRKR